MVKVLSYLVLATRGLPLLVPGAFFLIILRELEITSTGFFL